MTPGYAYNGVFRATVVPAQQGAPPGLWVVVPRLNGNDPMGPCQWLGTGAAPANNTQVLVATIAGIKDDIVVLGPVKST